MYHAIAEEFNKYFYTVFNNTETCKEYPVWESNQSIPAPKLCNMQLSESAILGVLTNLDIRKATEPDNRPPVLLKECCYELCAPLCSLYNRSLSGGCVPAEWLIANVIPLFKIWRQTVT